MTLLHLGSIWRSDPPHERLDALGRVQSRLMSGLVQEKVWRATEHPPQGWHQADEHRRDTTGN